MCNKNTTHENGLFTRDRDGYRKEEEATRDLLNYDGCGDGQKPSENLLGQIRQFLTAHQNFSDARCGTTSDTSGEEKQNPARTSSLHRSQWNSNKKQESKGEEILRETDIQTDRKSARKRRDHRLWLLSYCGFVTKARMRALILMKKATCCTKIWTVL